MAAFGWDRADDRAHSERADWRDLFNGRVDQLAQLGQHKHRVADELGLAAPLGLVGGVPAEYSILRFTPDDRFATVHFEGYRGDELVVSLTLPFIGWAVVVNWVQGGAYGTRLEAVGLSEHGEPVIAYLIGQNFSLDEGKVIQTKLTPAEGSGVAESQPWPTELYPSS